MQLLGTVIGAFSSRYLQGETGQQRYISALAGVLAAVHLLLLADHWAVLLEKEQPVFHRLTSPARDLHIQLMIDLVKKRSGLSIQIAEYQQSGTLYEVSLLPREAGPPPPAAKLFRTPGIWSDQVIPQNFDKLPLC